MKYGFVSLAFVAACGSDGGSDVNDAGVIGDGAPVFEDAGIVDSSTIDVQPPQDAAKAEEDGAFPQCDGGAIPADRFVTRVVKLTPGDCAGFGAAQLPAIVEGPPEGAGASHGSVDVLSLGNGGSIVLSFEPNAIVDGPGADFIVFENAFDVSGDPTRPSAELGEVSVSDDGNAWTVFPCVAAAYPYGECAGWHPVYSSPYNCISPIDPKVAGGDAFDLASIGVAHARYVRIVDKANVSCPSDPSQKLTTNGFDLDAISIVNAETP